MSTIIIFNVLAIGDAITCARSMLFDLYLSNTGPYTTSCVEESYTACIFSETVPEGPYT
jgi:hypothetical protein